MSSVRDTPDPASDPIDAVAAVIEGLGIDGFGPLPVHEAQHLARALAEAGWLRTAEDRPIDRDTFVWTLADNMHDATGWDACTEIAEQVAESFLDLGWVAAGGTVPADPEGQP